MNIVVGTIAILIGWSVFVASKYNPDRHAATARTSRPRRGNDSSRKGAA